MKQQLLATILFSLVCVSLQAKTYATVDGVAITDKDMEILKQSIPNFNYNKLSEQEKEMLINELINRQLILKAAKQEKLDTSKIGRASCRERV